MTSESISKIIFEETKSLPNEVLKEVLDFILFLKSKGQREGTVTQMLSLMQQSELSHLEIEFENYKVIYPNE